MNPPTAPGTGRQGFQVVNSECSNNSNTAALPLRQHTVAPIDGQKLITVLAELFLAFTADSWEPHRPLKLGIGQELVALGILTETEVNATLRLYTNRLMYRRSIVLGAVRVDLDGRVVGEVTLDEAAHAKAAVTAIEARQRCRAKAAKAAADKQRADRRAARAPVLPKMPTEAQPTTAAPSTKLASLADLKAAAAARKKGASACQR
jgi:sRNA-binding protein